MLRYFRRYQASLNYYRKALTAASLDKESPFPMEIHIARVGTLVQMGSHNQAKRLIDEIMQRADGDLKARSELLIYRAKILSQTNVAEAISSLNESSTISGNNGFLQTQADAEEELAEIYSRLTGITKRPSSTRCRAFRLLSGALETAICPRDWGNWRTSSGAGAEFRKRNPCMATFQRSPKAYWVDRPARMFELHSSTG